MEFITSLTRKELEQIITDSVTKCLNGNPLPSQPETSDRCQLNDACEITGLSKAAIYKLTHERGIPHAKFGSRLVFSRRQLAAWIDSRTISPESASDEMNIALAAAAKKHLRNGNK